VDIKYLQIVAAALTIEIINVLVLVILGSAFRPEEAGQSQALLQNFGHSLGPVVGVLLCFIGSYLFTRTMTHSKIPNGVLLGLLVAIIEMGILLGNDADFQIVFMVSNTGRVIAGALGAYLADSYSRQDKHDV
tara:strand:- start:2336 stop:2734 length:399 start_codon:yes stop_codon:yes gene_type:complete